MTITGNVKFFKKNSLDNTTTITTTTASSANYSNLYDNDRDTKLISSGSGQGDSEEWIFEFSGSPAIDRIHVDNHNIYTGNIQYWNGSAYVDFSTPIAWTTNVSASSNYYEFNQVNLDRIKLTMTHTIDGVDKSVGQIRFMEEAGTVSANPSQWSFEFDEFSINHRTASAGSVYVFLDSKYIASMLFSDATDADVSIFQSLKNLGDPFYIYPCGGITTHTQIGFRTQDIYFVNYINNFKPMLKSNLLGIGTVINLDLREV